MKKVACFIISTQLLLCCLPVFSQGNTQPDKRETGLLTHIELLDRLKTASEKQKADICFWLSWRYVNNRKMDSARYYSDKLQQLTNRSAYEPDLGKYYLTKGTIFFFASDFKAAAEYLNRAILIFTRHNDLLSAGMAYRFLALYYLVIDNNGSNRVFTRANYNKSIAALRLSKGITAKHELMRTYLDFGRHFLETYEIDSASVYLLSSLALAEEVGYELYLFNASYKLGDLYLTVNDPEKAAMYLKKALDIGTPKMDIVMRRKCLALYAMSLIRQQKFSDANHIIEQYTALNQKFGDGWGSIILFDLKGSYEFYKRNYADAVSWFRRAYNRLNEIQTDWPDVTNITFHLARAEYEAGVYDSAVVHLLQTLVYGRALQAGFNNKMDAYYLLSKTHEKKRNMDSAYYYFQIYAHAKDSLLSLQKQKVVMDLTSKYESEKKEQQIILLQNETELYGLQLDVKTTQIEKQNILDKQRAQELSLLQQQNEIGRLMVSEKTLAYENQQKETARSQKEKELQAAIAAKENQRKKFAYIAIAIILLFSGFVVFRSVQNKKLSKQLAVSLTELKQTQEQLIQAEKEKEAENIRYRISRDIHDEVGATLSGVALFSEIAKQKMEAHSDQDAKVYLEHISANSKEMVEKMSEIVWAINPENDSFERIVSRLQAYALNMCGGKNIKLHTDIDEFVLDQHPEMNIRKNIYLIIKEAINNAIKYSGGKNLFFSLQQQNGHIIALVKDDGKGFNVQTANTGNGLNNMRTRAAELNGKFMIVSQTGKGTEVRLEFDFHPGGGHREVV
jgi:two-component system, NarL family, sensor histidine kinase UhpB